MEPPQMKLVEDLSVDHELIERVCGALRTYVTSTLADAAPRSDAVRFGRFFRVFVGEAHHQREESVLFAALIQRLGLPADRGPIAALEAQHRELALLWDSLEPLLMSSDRDVVTEAPVEPLAERYVHLLLRHIDAENSVLFPESVARLTRGGVRDLPAGPLSPEEVAAQMDGELLVATYPPAHDPSAFRGEGCVMCPSFGTTCDGIERTWWNESEWDEFPDRIG